MEVTYLHKLLRGRGHASFGAIQVQIGARGTALTSWLPKLKTNSHASPHKDGNLPLVTGALDLDLDFFRDTSGQTQQLNEAGRSDCL
jgi:hypothetical protein